MDILGTILNGIRRFFKCAWNHKVISSLIIVAFAVAIIINSVICNASIKYESIQSGIPTVQRNLDLSYDKSSTYKESISVESVLEDSIGEVSESASEISEIKNILSKAKDANGKSGNLLIPIEASDTDFEDLHIYEWKKTYSQFFGLLPCKDIEVVCIMGDSALSGEISQFSTGVLAGISVYHLAQST